MSDRLVEALDALNRAREQRLRVIEPPADLFSNSEPDWTEPVSMSPAWRDAVLAEIERVARTHREFTVQDLNAPACYDARAVGAVMVAASRKGWMRRIGWVGGGPERHGRPVALWASNLYRGGNHAL